jgi:putative ABC transport system permease protein
VLLCDEPTGALDIATGILVLEAIQQVNRELGTTTAVITHNAAVAGMADRVVSLADGRIASEKRNAHGSWRRRSWSGERAIRPLDRKLLRDLWALKGQGLAISLVMAAGVAMFVMYLSTFASLRDTQATYYERYRFGHVFAGLVRAPLFVRDRAAAIPGVARADARVVVDVTLDVPGLTEPASGRLVGIDIPPRPMLNDVFLRSGRFPAPGRPDEVLVSEAFAIARDLGPGDRIGAIINGRRRDLQIAGIALSPEYVYSIRPGELIPDDTRFGVFWMDGRTLAAAFDMEGGFNHISLTLLPGASEADVIARLDRVLASYGGLGAIPRDLQTSHWYLESELQQLQSVGLVLPIVFLLVAAFLLNVVLTRIVSVQREQIAALKALGYSNGELGWHYAKLSLLIGLVGAAIGVVAAAPGSDRR